MSDLEYGDGEMNSVMTYTLDEAPASQEGSAKVSEKRENVRSFIATLFVGGYLALVLLLIILSAFYKFPSESSKDFLLAISSPLGFVIGFYFKSASDSGKQD